MFYSHFPYCVTFYQSDIVNAMLGMHIDSDKPSSKVLAVNVLLEALVHYAIYTVKSVLYE